MKLNLCPRCFTFLTSGINDNGLADTKYFIQFIAPMDIGSVYYDLLRFESD